MPIVGYFDFPNGQSTVSIVDLKTTEKMPSENKGRPRPADQPLGRDVGQLRRRPISLRHAEEVALYLPASRTRSEHRNALHHLRYPVENFLALSEDPSFFLGVTAPDLDSFYWTNPAARQLAFEHWRI